MGFILRSASLVLMPLNMAPQAVWSAPRALGHLEPREVTVPKGYEWKILETFGGEIKTHPVTLLQKMITVYVI